MRRRAAPLALALALAATLALALALWAPSGASAQEEPAPPVTELEATAIADKNPEVVRQRRLNPGLTSGVEMEDGDWEVGYFAGDEKVALVIVDDVTGERLETWTGYQVAWKMARGYEGSFGHKLNAPYVFIPLCLIFLIGLVDWRRVRRIANLDLLVLLSFAVSHYFFQRANIGVSVPLQYPPLLYLLGRCIWIGFRGRGEGLRPVWPAAWLLIAALFLLGFRGGLNLADSGVIDVGYASVVGADNIADGESVYGNFPEDVDQGDTYGPVNYFAYVPFEQVWPWSGSWDELRAGHGAAVAFDVAVFLALLLLGTRLRPGAAGRKLAATMGFAWAAYPYAAYTLESNSNDSLVALLMVAVMLALARPAARGIMAALATLTKFVPAILVPMLATYDPAHGGRGLRQLLSRRTLVFTVAFAVTAFLCLAPTIFGEGLSLMYDRTIAYQDERDSPFSIWGQVDGLDPLRFAILGLVALSSIALAFRPRIKTPVQVAAFAAALLIGLQLVAQHWFYLYIVWFFPLALVAFAALSPERGPGPALSPSPGRRDPARPPHPSPRRRLRPSRNGRASGSETARSLPPS